MESIFIDQAALNGTRPNSPSGVKPARPLVGRYFTRSSEQQPEHSGRGLGAGPGAGGHGKVPASRHRDTGRGPGSPGCTRIWPRARGLTVAFEPEAAGPQEEERAR